MSELRVIPLGPPGEVLAGADLSDLVVAAARERDLTLLDTDVLVVTSKVVSKAEGRVVAFDGSEEAKERLIAAESRRVLRRRAGLRITETHHGFVNANAGIDVSNARAGTAVLLPIDPDRSARGLRARLRERHGVEPAVVITDTFGRTWRHGVTDVAIGVAGLHAVLDLRGRPDQNGRILEVTEIAIADEIAGAANLVLPKAAGTPFAVLRGIDPEFFGPGSVAGEIVRPPGQDLFR